MMIIIIHYWVQLLPMHAPSSIVFCFLRLLAALESSETILLLRWLCCSVDRVSDWLRGSPSSVLFSKLKSDWVDSESMYWVWVSIDFERI